MIALTDQYLAALVKHDPSGLPLARGVRFTENTAEIRIGDGLWVGASMAIIGTLTCTAQVDSGILTFITRLWPRRLGLVDEEKGLVYAFPMFQHRGAVHDIQIKGAPGVDVVHMNGGT